MKKNKMMRLASVLLVCVLLTTSVISGTFAKYVTTAEAGDSARVAKWGITMDANGTGLFKATYATDVTGGSGNSVAAANGTDKVVAPGTTGSAIYAVSGAPETAYEITFTGTKKFDVFLAAGLKYTYADADADSNGAVTYTAPGNGSVGADYYPVYYTVKIDRTSETDASSPTIEAFTAGNEEGTYIKTIGTAQTFDTLEKAMSALSNTKLTFAPNQEAGLTVTISWVWAFDDTDENFPTNMTKINDAYDTVLGDIAAQNADLTIKVGTTTKDGATIAPTGKNYSTQIEFDLAITATQVD